MKHFAYPRKFPDKFQGITFWKCQTRRHLGSTLCGSPWDPNLGLLWDQGSELILIPERKQFVYRHTRFDDEGNPQQYPNTHRNWYGGFINGQWFLNELSCSYYDNPVEIVKNEGLERFDRYLKPYVIQNLQHTWNVKPKNWRYLWAVSLNEDQLRLLKRMLRTLIGHRLTIKTRTREPWSYLFSSQYHFDGECSTGVGINGELLYVAKGLLWKHHGPAIDQKPLNLLDLRDGNYAVSKSEVWTGSGPPF